MGSSCFLQMVVLVFSFSSFLLLCSCKSRFFSSSKKPPPPGGTAGMNKPMQIQSCVSLQPDTVVVKDMLQHHGSWRVVIVKKNRIAEIEQKSISTSAKPP